MKKIWSTIIAIGTLCFVQLSYAAYTPSDLQVRYPHWNIENVEQHQALQRIDRFIRQNKDKAYVAAFDWDGTLYSEQIPMKECGKSWVASGQSGWHLWGAAMVHHSRYAFLFPMFHTVSTDARNNLIEKDDYLEGRTNVKVSGYNKFAQIATFEAGMTPREMAKGIEYFLSKYAVQDYAYLPMLDVMQQLVDHGFQVWIVTGSSPYYVSVLLQKIEEDIPYTSNKSYNFHISHIPYRPTKDRIIGNAARLMLNGRFSMVYDDRFTENKARKLYIVDNHGKQIAMQHYIVDRLGKKIKLYAGNSGGDVDGMQYVLQQSDAIGLAVNPRGALQALVKTHPHDTVVLHMRSKKGLEHNFLQIKS